MTRGTRSARVPPPPPPRRLRSRRRAALRRRSPLPPGVSRAQWDHPTSRFAREVLAGMRVSGVLVRRAARRHLRDLCIAGRRGWTFDPAKASSAIEFFEQLRHTKGEWAGRPVTLAPWQVFVIGCVYGWVSRETGFRRFQFAYIETAKKSGKSTLAGGVALLTTFFDSPFEHGAEGYTAATKRDQAKVTWGEARAMVEASPGLAALIHPWGGTSPAAKVALAREKFRQTLQPLGKDSKGLHGINPHCAVVDELHEHPDRKVWDTIRSSRGTRRQPLIFAITNSGYDETTVCWEQREHAAQILDGGPGGLGLIEDDRYFAFVACIDPGDDWRDERVWPKANPSLGVTVKLDDVRTEADMAKAAPGYINTFRRYYCGEWVAVEERAIDMDRWNACGGAVDLEAMKGRPCYGGLDLSSTIDLTCWILLFPPTPAELEAGDGVAPWTVLARFFMPKETMVEAERRDRVDYLRWHREGWITPTPSGAVDYGYVERQIFRDAELYQVRAIGYDPCQAERTRQTLEDLGYLMIKIRQGTMTLGKPTKTMESLYVQGLLRHGGNPVLRWCASNLCWRRDSNDLYMPDKGRAGRHRQRIDGISALVNALGAAEYAPPPPPRPYLDRGVTFV